MCPEFLWVAKHTTEDRCIAKSIHLLDDAIGIQGPEALKVEWRADLEMRLLFLSMF